MCWIRLFLKVSYAELPSKKKKNQVRNQVRGRNLKQGQAHADDQPDKGSEGGRMNREQTYKNKSCKYIFSNIVNKMNYTLLQFSKDEKP